MRISCTVALFLLAGCDPASMTLLGVGASTGVSQVMNGTTHRSFSAPAPKVRSATIQALKRMEIRVDSSEKKGNSELIKAKAGARAVDIELEKVSANTTRMSVTVKQGALQYDGATAAEIIQQTGKLL